MANAQMPRRDRSESTKHNNLSKMGLNPQAIKINVGLLKRLNAFGCILIFIVGVVGFVLSRDFFLSGFFLAWIIIAPVIFILSRKLYNDIVIDPP